MRLISKATARSGRVAFLLFTLVFCTVSWAENEPLKFDLSAQPLDQAVTALAKQAGLSIGGNAELLRGKQASALKGEYTPEQALQILLQDSNVNFRFVDRSTIVLERATDSKLEKLEKITVDAVLEGTRTTSYRANDSFAATRTNTPLIETPQSAQSITRQAIEDAGADTLADTYDYLAGVTRDNTQGGLQGDEYIVRGFDTENVLFNGNRTSSASTLDTQNVERVEVLRGVTGLLFGRADPGGLINIVTKQPLDEPLYIVEGQYSSGISGDGEDLDKGRVAIDIGGPLNEQKTLRYRLNAAYDDEQSFREDVDEEVKFISPVIEYEINDKTIANIEIIYQEREDTFDRGLFEVNGDLVLDLDFNVAENNTGVIDKEFLSGTVRLDHEFAPGWKARLGVYASDDERDGDAVQQGGVTGQIANRQRRDVKSVDKFLTIQPEITGEFSTGSIGHTVLVGADWADQSIDFRGIIGPATSPIDVFNPDFSVPIPPLDPAMSSLFDSKLDSESLSFYLQDQIDLTEQWKLLLGIRWEEVRISADTNVAFGPIALNPEERFKDSETTGRVGLVYQPIESVGMYISYAESYRAPVATLSLQDSMGNEVDAETGDAYEFGVKYESPNGNFGGTAAVYHIDKDNVLDTDPDDPFGFLSAINVGKVRSEGFELDFGGEITDNISVSFSYAYTDVRTTESSATFTEGTRLRNVPRNAASFQGSYKFMQGSLQGLRVFGGWVYEDSRRTSQASTDDTMLPAYSIFNLGADYEITNNVKATVLVKNIFDEEYYTSAAGALNIGVGDPLRVDFGLKATF